MTEATASQCRNSAVTVSTEYAEDSYAITAETNGEGTVSVLTAETKSSDKAKSGETVRYRNTGPLKVLHNGQRNVTTASGKTVEATTTQAINGTNAHEYTFTMPGRSRNRYGKLQRRQQLL